MIRPPRAVRRQVLAALMVAACATGPLSADDAVGRVVRDEWDVAFINGGKAGYSRFTVREQERGGTKVLAATRELDLTLKRFGDVARVHAETGSVETPDGKVLEVSLRQGLGKNLDLNMLGVVEDGRELRISVKGKFQFDKAIPWDPEVLALIGEHDVLRRRKPAAGASVDYSVFEPTVMMPVRVRVAAHGEEEVAVEGQGKRKLLRVESTPEKLQGVQLPTATAWLDPKTFDAVRTAVDMPGLGQLVLVRGDQAGAMAPLGPLTDIKGMSVPLSHRIERAHAMGKVVYRVTLPGLPADGKLSEVFPADETKRQETKRVNVADKSLDLAVTARRAPPEKSDAAAPPAEFTSGNYFVNSDDELVRKHAAAAVAALPADKRDDPWAKARAVERWVRDNMRVLDYTENMAPADHVAKTLAGDCTEFAMLSAAMCRAAGVPSRTAMGLVYFEAEGKPFFAYHMWYEVWVRGQWLALDATQALGSVGPEHVKIADHSWQGANSLVPLIPVTGFLGYKPRVEVLRVER